MPLLASMHKDVPVCVLSDHDVARIGSWVLLRLLESTVKSGAGGLIPSEGNLSQSAGADDEDWVTSKKAFEVLGVKENWLYNTAKKHPEITRVVKRERWHKQGKRFWGLGALRNVIGKGNN